MKALKEQIRPKFEIIGERIRPFLAAHLGAPVHVHIAKHARRTVHPPEETWVAWSTNARGYKAHPHFQFGIRDTHLFIWFALIYECEKKAAFARLLRDSLEEVWPLLPDDYLLSQDHTVPEATPKGELGQSGLLHLLERLEKVKKAEFLCGRWISRRDAVALDGEKLVEITEQTLKTLLPLYRLAADA
jgi:uncharacterized protein YktB (UPF0637 family)